MTHINTELENNKPKFSHNNLEDAFTYASESITIPSNELGMDVYLELYKEKFQEYISKVEIINATL